MALVPDWFGGHLLNVVFRHYRSLQESKMLVSIQDPRQTFAAICNKKFPCCAGVPTR